VPRSPLPGAARKASECTAARVDLVRIERERLDEDRRRVVEEQRRWDEEERLSEVAELRVDHKPTRALT
jgi:hypothetical protein